MSDPKLLVCYDGSDDAKQAIDRAARLFPGRAAVVLHVWEPLREVASVPPVPGLHGVLEAGLAEMDKEGADLSQQTAGRGGRAGERRRARRRAAVGAGARPRVAEHPPARR